MKEEIIEKIFYTEKELKNLKDVLCANKGRSIDVIKSLILNIDDILDYIEYIKETEIFKQGENELTPSTSRPTSRIFSGDWESINLNSFVMRQNEMPF